MSFNRTRNIARVLLQNKKSFRKITSESFRKKEPVICNVAQPKGHAHSLLTNVLLSTGILSFFLKQEELTPEQKLVDTIKRSILCIQRQQYDKAEQMLHLALRMAQDQQNKNGITYVYDVMANLAMEREQYQKAEKLFVDVMKRLFAEGYTEDSNKILHISSKIAHMAQLSGNLEKAAQGFKWTLGILENKMKSLQDDEDLRELWALTCNWFGQLLLEQGKYEEARKRLQDAYDVYTSVHGKVHSEVVTLLNNLSVACTKLDDYTQARKFLDEALELAEQFPELAEAAVLKANLGLLYLQQGMLKQAKEVCSLAWRLGKKFNNDRAMDQADHCLKTIKEMSDVK